MKTPEEWEVELEERQSFTCLDFVKIIREIQTEAYNQAIRDTAELADNVFPECDAFTILKLLKK